jgi:hypothetical protein
VFDPCFIFEFTRWGGEVVLHRSEPGIEQLKRLFEEFPYGGRSYYQKEFGCHEGIRLNTE